MARREGGNLILMQDNLSDSVLGVYCRQPSTTERQSYINKRSIRKGNKFIDNSAAVRVEFGKRIITGLRDDDFERSEGPDKYRPISSTPGSPDYYEPWKDWMETHCADVLTALAIRIFEVPVTSAKEDDGDDEGEPAGEDLEKE